MHEVGLDSQGQTRSTLFWNQEVLVMSPRDEDRLRGDVPVTAFSRPVDSRKALAYGTARPPRAQSP